MAIVIMAEIRHGASLVKKKLDKKMDVRAIHPSLFFIRSRKREIQKLEWKLKTLEVVWHEACTVHSQAFYFSWLDSCTSRMIHVRPMFKY